MVLDEHLVHYIIIDFSLNVVDYMPVKRHDILWHTVRCFAIYLLTYHDIIVMLSFVKAYIFFSLISMWFSPNTYM